MGIYKRGDNWYIDYRVKGKRLVDDDLSLALHLIP